MSVQSTPPWVDLSLLAGATAIWFSGFIIRYATGPSYITYVSVSLVLSFILFVFGLIMMGPKRRIVANGRPARPVAPSHVDTLVISEEFGN